MKVSINTTIWEQDKETILQKTEKVMITLTIMSTLILTSTLITGSWLAFLAGLNWAMTTITLISLWKRKHEETQ